MDNRGITRVDACILDVFRNTQYNDFAIACHCINLNFLSTHNEFRYHDWVFPRNDGSLLEVRFQVCAAVDHTHTHSRQNIGRPHEARVGHFVTKFMCSLNRCQLLPLRLIDRIVVTHAREFKAIFSVVNHFWRSTKDPNSLSEEIHCHIVRDLTTHTEDHTDWTLELVHVHRRFECQLVKVHSRALVVVSRYSLWIVVEHDSLVSKPPKFADTANRAVVELNRRSNAIDARSKYHRVISRSKVYVVFSSMISQVEIVGLCGILGSNGINLLDERKNVQSTSNFADLHFIRITQRRDFSVRKSQLLCTPQNVVVESLRVIVRQRLRQLSNALKAIQKPPVNLGKVVETVYGISLCQRRSQTKVPYVGGILEFSICCRVAMRLKTIRTIVQHAN
mmetsp:Transcript_13419/g.34357  ORF Transcript_13419/g.34357 Transcript_13419/m.34357 type:complete len:392 (-) Transcript_13419:148-1323(-)